MPESEILIARALIAAHGALAFTVAERGAANVRRLGMEDKAKWWQGVGKAVKEIEAAPPRGRRQLPSPLEAALQSARGSAALDLDQTAGAIRWHSAPMEDRAEVLQRRIAHYRRLLEEGMSSELASAYLCDLMAAQMELDRITGEKRR